MNIGLVSFSSMGRFGQFVDLFILVEMEESRGNVSAQRNLEHRLGDDEFRIMSLPRSYWTNLRCFPRQCAPAVDF